MTDSRQIGSPTPRYQGFVQVEREALEALSTLIAANPKAAQLLTKMVAFMGEKNALVVSQTVLAQITGMSHSTAKRALKQLVDDRWVQVVQIGNRGTTNAYVINDRVAWAQPRDQKARLSVFSAQVLTSAAEQSSSTLEGPALRRVPTLIPPEMLVVHGEGGEPGSQIALPGLEPVIERSSD